MLVKIDEITIYLVSSLSVSDPGFLQQFELVVLLLSLAALEVYQGYVYKCTCKTIFMTVTYGQTVNINIVIHIRTNFAE